MVVTFGEIMMRLAPPGYLRFTQTQSLEMTFGGGEANVAVSIANFGDAARFVTALPEGDLGDTCIRELRKNGVDTGRILRRKGRIGIYFCEKGASQRPSKVIYDRADSVISNVQAGDFDWDTILEGATWFHFTGITPALGEGPAACVEEALQAAKRKGIPASCDLNYRKKLWSKEQAGTVMGRLMPYVDVLIANESDAADVFGIRAPESDVVQGTISRDGYKAVAEALTARFGFAKVAITLRESISASQNNWSALLYDGKDREALFSRKYAMQIVDRVGGGDSFAGGLIYGLTHGYPNAAALEFAVAASCLKHSIEGDFNAVSLSEVEALAGGDGSGRVQR